MKERAWRTGGMMLMGKIEELGEKPIPVSFCPPQIHHELAWIYLYLYYSL